MNVLKLNSHFYLSITLKTFGTVCHTFLHLYLTFNSFCIEVLESVLPPVLILKSFVTFNINKICSSAHKKLIHQISSNNWSARNILLARFLHLWNTLPPWPIDLSQSIATNKAKIKFLNFRSNITNPSTCQSVCPAANVWTILCTQTLIHAIT